MAKSEKIIVLGVDGLDPVLTKKYADKGYLPNIKKIIDMGAQREDLVMLGAHPTITPPMWGTLANGAYPITHGVTCFWNHKPGTPLDELCYALDSREFNAEPLWNVFAEDANKKTLVFHWPGGAWPATSPSENLLVVDGTQPAMVGMGTDVRDWEKLIVADKDFDSVVFKAHASNDSGAGCIITDIDTGEDDSEMSAAEKLGSTKPMVNIILSHEDGEEAVETMAYDLVNSPIKEPKAWGFDLPEGAKEFTILVSGGVDRRPCLVLKDESGKYTKVAMYKTKRETEPLAVLTLGEISKPIVDVTNIEAGKFNTARMFKVISLDENGDKLRIWASNAMDVDSTAIFHPATLQQKVIQNVGPIPPAGLCGGNNAELVREVVVPSWREHVMWQAKAMNYIIEEEGCEIVFSHVHNVDAMGHLFWKYAKEREGSDTNPEEYLGFIEQIYRDTDEYIGEFMHMLDDDWTILITSDHGLLCTEEHPPLLGDPFGVNIRVMEEMGYTSIVKDADGNDTKAIDWENTTAISARGYIYVNLKGRDDNGTVDPADKYDFETKLIDDLYNYRDPHTGKRIIAVALRNKDAAILGVGGPNCGDIIFWLTEGNNRLHGDSLSTYTGHADTSVSPIFIAAGKGLKKSYKCERMIRQIDFTQTIAALGGVRAPAQSEGGIVHQILEED